MQNNPEVMPAGALQSASVGNIAHALAAAQAAFSFASKSSEAVGQGGQRRRYADLQSVLDAVRKGLASNGIAVCQQAEPFEGGFFIRTVLIHESGEWLASLLPVHDSLWRNPPVDAAGRPRAFNPMQQLGSCITYARRYALSALAGISQDDDDAESLRQAPAAVEPVHGPVEARNAQNRTAGRGNAQNASEGRADVETRLRKNEAPTAPREMPEEGTAPQNSGTNGGAKGCPEIPVPNPDLPDDAPASKEENFGLIRWLCFKGITNRKAQQEFMGHQCGFDSRGWTFFQLTVGHLRRLNAVQRKANGEKGHE